ncbi:TPA: YktB family protein [Staphylococcus aureus]|uniref:YktB family protein n=1 Tax=Staphylococcus aureus TaxID=1280 RepID=UPI001E3AF153|nr:YktB family protein [Staphylococcus aureus]UGS49590.1 YktB family protein [Staphylococcus aureus]HCY2927586.1 YktB family protein [Staphylococcus aureus]HDB5872560.1 YktB family protein [Staphylococcus aureus]HDB7699925.1 YktB family protein [Staphylococcus aureus]HDB7701720.1 YktB family protein [Staphylococcus aureus]
MTKYTFKPKDFKAFNVEGLDARMEALNEYIRPQLHELGEYFSDFFTSQTGETFYPHVAKHARRSVNPPKDTWVAFATSKRGYKMLPHFQIGMFEDQLFVMFGIMHEAKDKATHAKVFERKFKAIQQLPDDYRVCLDHMKPDKPFIKDLTDDDLKEAIQRAINVKKGEFFIARAITPQDKRLKSDKAFIAFLEETFDQFLPFYSA